MSTEDYQRGYFEGVDVCIRRLKARVKVWADDIRPDGMNYRENIPHSDIIKLQTYENAVRLLENLPDP